MKNVAETRDLDEATVREKCQCTRQGCECHRPRGRVHCAAHGDEHPSLSVTTKNETLVLNCFAGCAFADIIAKLRDPAPLTPIASNAHAKPAKPRTIIRTRRWEIRDVDWAHVATHVRLDFDIGPKQPWWELPDGTNGLGGIKTADLPLYAINELDNAQNVVLCEGEPATDAVIAYGQAAVGTVCGSGIVPGDASLHPLLNVPRISFWPDHDMSGYPHMRKIALRLLALGYPGDRLGVIDWTDAPPKGDAVQFRDAGNTPDDFMHVLDGALSLPALFASRQARGARS